MGSVFLGTFGALYQVRIKRFIASASISQIGFILVGISCFSLNGLLGSFIHTFIYILVNLIFFTTLLDSNSLLLKRNALFMHELFLLKGIILRLAISFVFQFLQWPHSHHLAHL